jgi:hypothetical protein
MRPHITQIPLMKLEACFWQGIRGLPGGDRQLDSSLRLPMAGIFIFSSRSCHVRRPAHKLRVYIDFSFRGAI